MERRERHYAGGIRGLAELIAEHGEALEFELITRGLHLHDLGTRRLSWTELRSLIRFLPPGNALQRNRLGEATDWTADTYLLALIADLLAGANWQRGGDKHASRPDPVKRPTLPGQASAAGQGDVIARGKGMSITDMRNRLGWDVDGRDAAR